MLSRTLFLSALVIAGAMGFSGHAQAETSDVPFSGTIVPKCTFDNVQAGTIAAVSDNEMYEDLGGFVDISCNTPATLSVADPTDNGSTGTTSFDLFKGAIIIEGGGEGMASCSPSAVIFCPTNPLSISGNSDPQSIYVGMDVSTSDAAIQAGDYKFKVTLTSTP